jgi:superfamily II DNA or RNA helicase
VTALHRALNPTGAPVSRLDGVREEGAVRVFDPDERSFLTGALPIVKRVLRAEGVRFRIRDLRSSRRSVGPRNLREVRLHGFQQEVVAQALARQSGIIDVGTGGGKTVLAAAIVAELGLPTLYLVTTRTLLLQTRRALERYLGVAPGIIGASLHVPRDVTVALAQALSEPTKDVRCWSDGLLIFDEGHHAVATRYFALIRRVRARYNYYLSATPFRENNEQAILDALTGGSLTNKAYRSRYLIERGYCTPVEVRFERLQIGGDMREKPFSRLYTEFIVENVERNRRIAAIARQGVEQDRSVLVLVEQKEHGRRLLRRLPAGTVLLHGERSRTFLQQQIARFEQGEIPCVVATAGLFVEGVSIDRIHVLIHAGGLKSRARVIQSIGRGMRRAPGKERCLYVDFFDQDDAGVFRAHSLQRARTLAAEGFDVPHLESSKSSPDSEAPESRRERSASKSDACPNGSAATASIPIFAGKEGE